MKIRGQALSHVIDAAADLWHGDDVDKRARRVRYRDLRRTAPQGFQSEQTFGFHAMEPKNHALRYHSLLNDAAGSKYQSFVEELLGEFPMVGGCPAADVAFTEKCRDKHPGICNHLLAAGQVQWHGNIETVTYPSQPALLSPAGKKLGGGSPVDSESLCRNVNRYHFLSGTENGGKPRSGGGQWFCFAPHGLYYTTRSSHYQGTFGGMI